MTVTRAAEHRTDRSRVSRRGALDECRRISVTIHGDVVDLGPLGALRRVSVLADWPPEVLERMGVK